jgi:ABC-type Zn uptake system ZnuABC Zn-binding protein ZnuA
MFFKKLAAVQLVLMALACVIYAKDIQSKPEIITTLFPTYDFAKQIGGDKVNVSLLLPPGVEPHSLNLSLRILSKLTEPIYLFIPINIWSRGLKIY